MNLPKIMTQEQYDLLIKFENQFVTAKKQRFVRNVTSNDFSTIISIYEDVSGKKANVTCRTCNGERIKFLGSIHDWWFSNKEAFLSEVDELTSIRNEVTDILKGKTNEECRELLYDLKKLALGGNSVISSEQLAILSMNQKRKEEIEDNEECTIERQPKKRGRKKKDDNNI